MTAADQILAAASSSNRVALPLPARPAGGMNVRADMATGMARQPQPGSPPTGHKLFLPFSSNREQKLVAKDTSATSSNLPVAPPLLDASITCMVRPSRELPAGLAFAIMETRGEARRTGEAGGKAGAHGTRLFLWQPADGGRRLVASRAGCGP